MVQKSVCLDELVLYFLNTIKSQAEEFTRLNSSTCNTPQKNFANNPPATTSSALAAASSGSSVQFQQQQNHVDSSVTDLQISGLLNNNDNSLELYTSMGRERNKSARKLFSSSSLVLNQSSEFHDSSARIDPFNDEPCEGDRANKTTTALPRGGTNSHAAVASRMMNVEQNKLKNKLFTSTPIRSRDDAPQHPQFNQTFPSHPRNPHPHQAQHPEHRRPPQNRNVTLADFMRLPESETEFPSLGAAPSRRKTTNSSLTHVNQSHMRPLNNTQQRHVVEVQGKQKPKRRVVPISVPTQKPSNSLLTSVTANTSTSNPLFGEPQSEFHNSPFQSENNLMKIQGEEKEFRSNLHNERKLLQSEKDSIKNDFDEEEQNRHESDNLRKVVKNLVVASRGANMEVAPQCSTPERKEANWNGGIGKANLENLRHKSRLNICAQIYSLIIDWSMTINVLSELAFLLNLVNIDVKLNVDLESGQFEELFKSTVNCVYFALKVLDGLRQKLLTLLDAKTMRILIENDRIRYFSPELVQQLQKVYKIKTDLEINYRKEYEEFSLNRHQDVATKTNQSVFYQEEDDTRDNFPSQGEFTAFRKQRDAFYTVLRLWEEKHLNSKWNFGTELGHKIRSIYGIMQHPINMAHLAKLFTNQLIVCCNNCYNFENNLASTEMLKRFENVDLDKLNKLEQRFVTPGDFSAELQFPGIQIFFKEFIIASELNSMFIEQLKMAMIGELIDLNGSTIDIFNISEGTNGFQFNEIVMNPEKMSIMRVLAKFIGFVVSRPFQYEGCQSKLIDNRQIMLRNLCAPQFDVMRLYEASLKDERLLITIPWLVQYLSMLDCVTLQLDYYKRVLSKMHDLYSNLTDFNMSPTSIFILRINLGWLFEQNSIATTFYTQTKVNPDQSIVGYGQFSAMLEKILTVTCPFLADFRMSLVQLNQKTKLLSRTTGRYRHIITTKIPPPITEQSQSNLPKIANSLPDDQSKLIEAFLHSQSPSVRKVIDFLIERISSTVIKNFQILHFLEIKKEALKKANDVKGSDKRKIVIQLKEIYSNALTELTNSWNNVVPPMIKDHVERSIDCLLPIETLEPVKQTCKSIIVKMCKAKTSDWRINNLNQIDVFSKDLNTEASKKLKNSASQQTNLNEKLVIDVESPLPSAFFANLQELQHLVSMRPHQIQENHLPCVLELMKTNLTAHTFFMATNKLTILTVHNVVLHLIAKRPELVSETVLNSLMDCFRCECLKELMTPPKKDKDDLSNGLPKDDVSDPDEMRRIKQQEAPTNYVFSGSVTVLPRCFLFSFRQKDDVCFNLLAQYLLRLIKNEFLNLEIFNEHLVSLLRYDWPDDIMENISKLARSISKELCHDTQKSFASTDSESLFLEMLSDLTTNIDEFDPEYY